MINPKMLELGSRRSTIRELFEYGKMLKAERGEENVCDFSLGNPSTPPPRALTEALEGLIRETEPCTLHGYSSAQGHADVRAAVANDLATRYGAKISPDRIYMTCGAAASLTIALRSLVCENGERILTQAPFFPEYRVFVEGVGGILDVADAKTDDFDLNVPDIAAKITTETRAVIINSPNNPTGVIYSEASLVALSELLKKCSAEYGHPIYIISDEPYRELTYGKNVPYLPDIYGDTLICYSYSKSLSLPGERIGYIAIPETVTDGDMLYAAVCGSGRALGYVCAPTLMQRAVAACVGEKPSLDAYRKNRDELYAALTVMGYRCIIPDGAFYLFVEAPGGDAVAFSNKAKEIGLLVVPSDDFGCKGYIRVSYCVSNDTVRRSFAAFGQVKELFND